MIWWGSHGARFIIDGTSWGIGVDVMLRQSECDCRWGRCGAINIANMTAIAAVRVSVPSQHVQFYHALRTWLCHAHMWWRPFVFIWCIVYTFLDLPKYTKGVINRLPMPHLVRKMVLHRFFMSIYFKFYSIWPPAAILDFGFSKILPPFSRRSWELIFFSKYPKELKSSIKTYYALGGHGSPGYHPTMMAVVLCTKFQKYLSTKNETMRWHSFFNLAQSIKGLQP